MEYYFVFVMVILMKENVLKVDSQEGDDPELHDRLKGAEPPTTMHPAAVAANRYKTSPKAKASHNRTTPRKPSLEEECDYLAYYCLKAYKTGKLCGKTIYDTYHNFDNYCQLDYANCMERYNVWELVHMGECFKLTILQDYQHYEYHDDLFMDQTYVISN